MNILILTPSNPICVINVVQKLAPIVKEDINFNSINVAALYKELTSQELNEDPIITYPVALFTYAKAFATNKQLRKKWLNKKINVFVGNLDRNTPTTFDHILGYEEEPWELENDTYLQEGQQIFAPVFEEQKTAPVEWYTKEDAQHIFPTIHHLSVMLNVLGVVNNAIDTVQSVPTTSN